MNKKVLMMIGAGVIVLALAAAAIFTALKFQQSGTEPVAPNAPQSKPKAASEPTGEPLQLTFAVGSTTTTAPTATPTTAATPAATSASTPVATSTATSAPSSTSVASATSTPSATAIALASATNTSTPAPTAVPTLPKAGLEGPTILIMIGGGLLLLVGIAASVL